MARRLGCNQDGRGQNGSEGPVPPGIDRPEGDDRIVPIRLTRGGGMAGDAAGGRFAPAPLTAWMLVALEEMHQAHAEARAANEALKAANAELRRMATTDGLTGLANRRYFEERAHEEIDRVRRYGGTPALLLLDIDRFKRINDNQGHLRGDATLVEVARRIRGVLRSTDLAARWGGDEFIILLPRCDEAALTHVAEKLRGTVGDTALAGIGPVTVSLGGALRAPDENLDEWLHRADGALYAAKAGGRNAVRIAPAAGAAAG